MTDDVSALPLTRVTATLCTAESAGSQPCARPQSPPLTQAIADQPPADGRRVGGASGCPRLPAPGEPPMRAQQLQQPGPPPPHADGLCGAPDAPASAPSDPTARAEPAPKRRKDSTFTGIFAQPSATTPAPADQSQSETHPQLPALPAMSARLPPAADGCVGGTSRLLPEPNAGACAYAPTLRQTEISEFRGVYATGAGGWRARIFIDGSTEDIGAYATALDAARAYDDYVVRHGLNRPLNFPATVTTAAASGALSGAQPQPQPPRQAIAAQPPGATSAPAVRSRADAPLLSSPSLPAVAAQPPAEGHVGGAYGLLPARTTDPPPLMLSPAPLRAQLSHAQPPPLRPGAALCESAALTHAEGARELFVEAPADSESPARAAAEHTGDSVARDADARAAAPVARLSSPAEPRRESAGMVVDDARSPRPPSAAVVARAMPVVLARPASAVRAELLTPDVYKLILNNLTSPLLARLESSQPTTFVCPLCGCVCNCPDPKRRSEILRAHLCMTTLAHALAGSSRAPRERGGVEPCKLADRFAAWVRAQLIADGERTPIESLIAPASDGVSDEPPRGRPPVAPSSPPRGRPPVAPSSPPRGRPAAPSSLPTPVSDDIHEY